jgi:outer membrane receptor for ferric coprogen and ferric-rhodotorulic acid
MYVKITNGTPEIYTIGQLRRDNPNTSFPKAVSDAVLASYDVFPLSPTASPAYDHTKNIRQGTPTEVDGAWTQVWDVSDASSEEIASRNEAQSIASRATRFELLNETDWWASSDLTMTAEQTAYRQALRDITGHANWPHLEEADWPTKP